MTMPSARRDLRRPSVTWICSPNLGPSASLPPAGARGTVDPMAAAERYRALLEIDEIGVVPQIEMWGGNRSMSRVSTAIYIALEAASKRLFSWRRVSHVQGRFGFLTHSRCLGRRRCQVFHWNDYPADPPRETIGDGDRVYPGDGVAPITDIVKGFLQVGAARRFRSSCSTRNIGRWIPSRRPRSASRR